MSNQARQLLLFPLTLPNASEASPEAPDRFSGEQPLAALPHWFGQEMKRLGMAPNTCRSYSKSARLLVRFLGPSRRLNQVSEDDLRRFWAWVEGEVHSPKTAELHLTAVRRLFAALHEAGVLPTNPAAKIHLPKASSPLPVVLLPGQARAVRQAAAKDVLPALLVTLFLDLGLRIGEAERLHADDIDLTNPLQPMVRIYYPDTRHRAKQRVLVGPPTLTDLAARYCQRHPPSGGDGHFFACSRRSMLYTIANVGQDAGLHRRLTPGMLRWTYALEQFQAGIDAETLRQRLGLSEIGWQDMEIKLRALARRPE